MTGWFEAITGFELLDPVALLLVLAILVAVFLRRWQGAPAIPFPPAAFLRRGKATSASVHSKKGGWFPRDSKKTGKAGAGGEVAERTGAHRGAAKEPSPGRETGGSGRHNVREEQIQIPSSWRVRLLVLPRLLQILGLVLAIVALARPVEREALPLVLEGIDILLCLDLSSSMTAHDLDPMRTRLEVAKEAAATFITGRPQDRIGLIGFARYPDIRCPSTLDHAALKRILAEVTTVSSDGPEDATGIGTAVARAAQVLQGSKARSKVVILLTDGEENVATAQAPNEIAPVHAAQLCRELGIKVYTIAAGAQHRSPEGVLSKTDTTQVERLASRTGGAFYSVGDAGALGSVYAEIDTLEKAELAEPRYRTVERFIPFLLAAVLALIIAGLLQATIFETLP